MNKNTAFTLLEILIVVVIIGVLAGLAIPKFSKTIETAKGKEAVVMLETIRTANRMYYMDNGKYAAQVNRGDPFVDLVPDYLPEEPNRNAGGNWEYGLGGLLHRIFAHRTNGIYRNTAIAMDIDGNLINEPGNKFYWPWPPE